MTTEVEMKIQANAAKNQELLAILSQTDYATATLQQQKRYIADLEAEIKQLDQNIKQLNTNREKELKDHEKYRDSVIKRFAYKVTRQTEKFETKASIEEQEYFAALLQQRQAEDARKSAIAMLEKAEEYSTELEDVARRNQTAQEQLDVLYDSIFDGPSPGFPEEDRLEESAHQALSQYHGTSTAVETEQQTLRILGQARQTMNMATASMQSAHEYSTWDVWGGGAYSDMQERSSLSKADHSVMETQMLIMQAQRINPHVGQIPQPRIDQGHIWGDVIFDNIFSDMAMHDRIKASEVEVRRCRDAVVGQEQAAKARLEEYKQKMAAEGRALDEARRALQKSREQAFERTLGYSGVQ